MFHNNSLAQTLFTSNKCGNGTNFRDMGDERAIVGTAYKKFGITQKCAVDVEVDLGQGRSGSAEITAFVKMYGDIDRQSEGVLVRWMDKSRLSTSTDDRDRPLCPYPLSSNHCLWEWSDTGRDRASFQVRGFSNKVRRENLWSHVQRERRADVIRSEIRARYDILPYDSIKGHVNIHLDPSTGHMLQTLQMI